MTPFLLFLLLLLFSQKNKDIRILRERCETQYQQIKALEKQTTDLNDQVKHFESEYCVEVEENKALKVENERLRHQLAAETSASCLEDTSSEEETIANYKKALISLKNQIDDLNDNLAKLRDHSKEQSRQILKLRQQAEMIEVTVLYFNVLLSYNYDS
jgi:regulator of replication initiation timing